MSAYYNEFDRFPAAWLRALCKEGHITDGTVDERSIADVRADDVSGHERAHFFAGIGGWEYALELAGWPADWPVWTGSCPCQPFSAAGKGLGEADPRHLWPEFRRLIAECRPPVVFGEQVASKAGRAWLAGVRADLEALGYAVGAADLCAASCGAPHIRQRLYWVAYSKRGAAERHGHALAGEACGVQGEAWKRERVRDDPEHGGADYGGLADSEGDGLAWGQTARERRAGAAYDGGMVYPAGNGREQRRPESGRRGVVARRGEGRVGHADEQGSQGRRQRGHGAGERAVRSPGLDAWSGGTYLDCTDGKARRVPTVLEPSLCLLADGLWYIMADVRAEFVAQAMMEVCAHAKETGFSSKQVVRLVLEEVGSEEVRWQSARGSFRIPSQEVLLAFMRDVLSALDGAANGSSGKEESAQASDRVLRDLRRNVETERASLRRESEEQLAGEPADSLPILSLLLARMCAACGNHEARANACAVPLATGVKGRVGQLRGYGNAIVPQVAAQFVSAFMEIIRPEPRALATGGRANALRVGVAPGRTTTTQGER